MGADPVVDILHALSRATIMVGVQINTRLDLRSRLLYNSLAQMTKDIDRSGKFLPQVPAS